MNQRVGVAWYRPWEWERLRQAAADAGELEATHAEWLRNAKKGCRKLDAAGAAYARIVVSVDELVASCGERLVPLDASARSPRRGEAAPARAGAKADCRTLEGDLTARGPYIPGHAGTATCAGALPRQHFLYLRPLPQGQGSLWPILR